METAQLSDTKGLDAIIQSQRRISNIRKIEEIDRKKDAEGLAGLMGSFGAPLLDSEKPSSPIQTSSVQTSSVQTHPIQMPTTPIPQKVDRPGVQQIQQTPKPSIAPSPILTPQNNSSVTAEGQTAEGQIQNLRELFGKMNIEVNGKPNKINLTEFTFEKQPTGNFRVNHPKLDIITDTPIVVNPQGKFQTDSIHINGAAIFAGISPGTYHLIQTPGKLVIAKR